MVMVIEIGTLVYKRMRDVSLLYLDHQ